MSGKSNPRVTELLATIKAAHEELAAIRKACAHPSYYITNWMWERPSFGKSRVCDLCHINVPGLTAEEAATIRGVGEHDGDGPYTQHMKYMLDQDERLGR